MDYGEEVHIMRILVNDLPKALTVDLMKEAATGGGYQAGQETSSSGVQTLPPCLIYGVVCRGVRICIPVAELIREGENYSETG